MEPARVQLAQLETRPAAGPASGRRAWGSPELRSRVPRHRPGRSSCSSRPAGSRCRCRPARWPGLACRIARPGRGGPRHRCKSGTAGARWRSSRDRASPPPGARPPRRTRRADPPGPGPRCKAARPRSAGDHPRSRDGAEQRGARVRRRAGRRNLGKSPMRWSPPACAVSDAAWAGALSSDAVAWTTVSATDLFANDGTKLNPTRIASGVRGNRNPRTDPNMVASPRTEELSPRRATLY